MTLIEKTDERALLPGVRYALRRSDWPKAPDFNPNIGLIDGKPAMRRWALAGLPAGEFRYQTLVGGAMVEKVYPNGAELAQPNFPGTSNVYPKYQPSSTPFIGYRPSMLAGIPDQPFTLVTESGATPEVISAVEAALSNSGISFVRIEDDGIYTYAPTEPRRRVKFSVAGVDRAAGRLYREMSKSGIGFPGKWVLSGSELSWAPAFNEGETIEHEWPVPNVVPVGYKPGISGDLTGQRDVFVSEEVGSTPTPGVADSTIKEQLNRIEADGKVTHNLLQQLIEAKG